MGQIFGISDLPVTIFTTPLEPVKVPEYTYPSLPRRIIGESFIKKDLLVLQNKPKKVNFINRIINGFREVI